MSVTFIPATVFDNPALLRVNPEYLAWLLSFPTLERERLLAGNWKIRPTAGLYFKREWCAPVDEASQRLARRSASDTGSADDLAEHGLNDGAPDRPPYSLTTAHRNSPEFTLLHSTLCAPQSNKLVPATPRALPQRARPAL